MISPAARPLFEGVVPQAARKYSAQQIVTLAKPFYNPCVGRFTVVEAAIRSGLPADKVWATDIGLFSSILGYLADPTKQLDALGIRILDPDLAGDAKDQFDFAAQVLLILKLDQFSSRNLRGLYLREELRRDWTRYRTELREQLVKLTEVLKGIHYDITDIWDVIDQVAGKDVSLFSSVPHYKGGYTKMFATSRLAWNKPAIPEFDPKRFPQMLEKLGGAKCATLLCRRGPWEEPVPAPWCRVFGRAENRKVALWIMANRTMQAYAETKGTTGDIRKFPIYDDHPITPDSRIQVLMVSLPTALYYRDLFVHRLGATTASRGFLMLVDGQVMTAFGMLPEGFMTFKLEYLLEMFGITRSSTRYKRLGKLFMLLLTSGEMKWCLCDLLGLWLHEPKGIQTSSITVGHEGKTDRSVMKIISRERLEDGRFKLVYRSDFRTDTFAEVLKDWLEKHGSRKRTKQSDDSETTQAHIAN
jgi:hypothetical protein